MTPIGVIRIFNTNRQKIEKEIKTHKDPLYYKSFLSVSYYLSIFNLHAQHTYSPEIHFLG